MQSDQLAGENSQKHAELKLKEDEVTGFKGEISRLTRLKEKVARNLRTVEEQKIDVESNREKLRQEITSMERGTYCVLGDTVHSSEKRLTWEQSYCSFSCAVSVDHAYQTATYVCLYRDGVSAEESWAG